MLITFDLLTKTYQTSVTIYSYIDET